MDSTKKEVICYGQTNTGNWCQEFYCTLSRQSRSRAKQLRDAGYKVITTHVGNIKMTMLTIEKGTNEDTFRLPYVKVESI